MMILAITCAKGVMFVPCLGVCLSVGLWAGYLQELSSEFGSMTSQKGSDLPIYLCKMLTFNVC